MAFIYTLLQVEFKKSLDKWHQTQSTFDVGSRTQLSPNDITIIWTNAAGGKKKGTIYGLGVQLSLCNPSPLLYGASTFKSSKELEGMRRKIAELIEWIQTSEANFEKVQKFMEKHIAESDSEEVDFDEE